VAIGFALATVHLLGIPLTGTSVNPARSIGPALFVGGDALSQIWLFIIAPLLGGVFSALAVNFFYPGEYPPPEEMAHLPRGEATAAPGVSASNEPVPGEPVRPADYPTETDRPPHTL
jgi:aquaporin Z